VIYNVIISFEFFLITFWIKSKLILTFSFSSSIVLLVEVFLEEDIVLFLFCPNACFATNFFIFVFQHLEPPPCLGLM